MNIPSWCSNYVGIPYSEVNCWGLIVLVYKEIYQIELTGITEQRDLIKSGFWFEVDDPRTPDVILFKESNVNRHVGLLLDNEYMMHADRSCDSVVIDRWVARNHKPRLEAIYRCKLLK